MKQSFKTFLLLLSSSALLASCQPYQGQSSSSSASSISEASSKSSESVISSESSNAESSSNDSSSEETVAPSLTLSQDALELEEYETATLTYALEGDTGMPSWSSSDPSVATVDSNGLVSAIKKGSCTIKATLGELQAKCEVNVIALSQAPRITLSETAVSLGQNETYEIDGYVSYKGKARSDALEISLANGADSKIAAASYEEGKIIINGLAYGQTEFIVHAKTMGVLLTASLHVKVAKPNLALSISNLESKEGVYSVHLANKKIDEDGYDTTCSPVISFTENGEPASYTLTYTSLDPTIASWDDDHKIVAKGVGETTLTVACLDYALSANINVSVHKGVCTVTLIDTGGSEATKTTVDIAAGKMVDSTPSTEGRKFVGWFDEDCNEVKAVNDDITLYAHYSVEHYDDSNPVLKKFSADDSEYTQPEGTDWKYSARGEKQRQDDISNGYYPKGVDGTQCFTYPDSDDKVAGVGLPAYDFSSSPALKFTFSLSNPIWPTHGGFVKLNGTDLGAATNMSGWSKFEVTVKGKDVSVYNDTQKSTVQITLDDDTYSGKKGLEITVKRASLSWLMVTPFVSFDCDYLTLMHTLEASLPEEPASGYNETVNEYSALREYMSEAEKTAFPISKKMQNWIDAIKMTKVLSFDDHGDSVYDTLTGDSSFVAKTYVQKYADNGWKDEARTDSLQLQILGLEKTYFTLTLPAFDFSSYGNVSFEIEIGGGNGDKTVRYWLGSYPDAASVDEAVSSSNYIGRAPSGTQWNWDTGGTKVAVSHGKITFSGFSESTEPKTLDLDESVNNGTEGLSLTVGWGSYNTLAISPFYASKV
jgi:hypothetical protein